MLNEVSTLLNSLNLYPHTTTFTMGSTYNYITSANDDAHVPFDVDSIGAWLVDRQIVDPLKPPEINYDGFQTVYDRGPHSERLFDMKFSDRPDGENVAQRADGCAVFQWDLSIYKLPNPVAVPVVTHNYPLHCPACGDSCDKSLQETWVEDLQKDGFEHYLRQGLNPNLAFPCTACSRPIALSEVSQQGPMLLRRHFIELVDSCYHTDKVAFLSQEARKFLEPMFGGQLALRSGWVT